MDASNPVVSALGVRDGKIVAAGSVEAVKRAVGRGCQEIEVPGPAAIPGLTDCHVHFGDFALRFLRLNLEGLNFRQILEKVAGEARQTKGRWIVGSGWDGNGWGRDERPTKEALDVVAQGHPVALLSKDEHTLWVNSAALREVGIDESTEDPPGGRICRDEATGEITGLLRENAVAMIWSSIPDPEPHEVLRAFRRAQKLANSLGLTGVHVPEGARTLQAFQELRSSGELSLRVYMMIPGKRLDDLIRLGIRTGLGDEMIRLGHLKLFADGSLGSQTALLLEPYEGEQSVGIEVLSKSEMVSLFKRASSKGIAVAIHAIGDAANRNALDAFESVKELSSAAGLRHRIEHAQLLHPGDIPRFARLGITASMQPVHATSDRYIAERHWGSRSANAYCFRSLLQSGAKLCFGSDGPVETIDPLKGVYAAAVRKRETEPESEPWYPAERISVYDAVYAYTAGAAHASGEENCRGMLKPGFLADFVVLSRDIFKEDPEEIKRTRVTMTVLGGNIVWDDLNQSEGES